MPKSERSTWTVPILAEFLEQRLEQSEARVSAQHKADQSAVQLAQANLERRLDAMNEFRGAMADQAARLVARSEFDAELNATRERLDAVIEPINRRIAEQGKPNWMLLVGLASVTLTVLAGCWLIIGLQINYAITPQVLAIEQLKASNTAQINAGTLVESRLRGLEQITTTSTTSDVESKADRARLNIQTERLAGQIANGQAERKEADARFTAALVEIETQFCASDAVRNMMYAQELRIMSILWSATHKNERFPTDNALYPEVCNRYATTRQANQPP